MYDFCDYVTVTAQKSHDLPTTPVQSLYDLRTASVWFVFGPSTSGGVLRFGSDGGVPLKPPNPYLSLRVILAEKGTHY